MCENYSQNPRCHCSPLANLLQCSPKRLLLTELSWELRRQGLLEVCVHGRESSGERCRCRPRARLGLQDLCPRWTGSTRRLLGLRPCSPRTEGAQMANSAALACRSVCGETALKRKGCGVRPTRSCKIESSAGIASAALHWFCFCLTDHKQFVYTDSFSSSTVNHKRVL